MIKVKIKNFVIRGFNVGFYGMIKCWVKVGEIRRGFRFWVFYINNGFWIWDRDFDIVFFFECCG